MHARATIAHYHPSTQEEATSILRDEMLPKARELQGFKGALILFPLLPLTIWNHPISKSRRPMTKAGRPAYTMKMLAIT